MCNSVSNTHNVFRTALLWMTSTYLQMSSFICLFRVCLLVCVLSTYEL
jgi:hypothetical protein